MRCTACGLVRTDFDPSQNDLNTYYDEAYYGDEGRRFPAPIEWAVARFRHRRVRAVLKYQNGPGRILDVGCGRGLMLADFAARGWEAVGTEFSPELARAVTTRFGFPVHMAADLSGFEADSFDVVTMWHSLEHLVNAVDTLREVHRILRPGGMAVVEVPNLGSWQAKLGGGRWFHLDAPRHLVHFSRDVLLDVAGDLGFGGREVHTFSLEYGPYGFVQTLLNRLTRQPNLLYARLKGRETVGLLDSVVTVIALPPAVLIGSLLEILAAMMGHGGIVRVTLSKKQ